MCLLFLNWCRECFAACVVSLFFSFLLVPKLCSCFITAVLAQGQPSALPPFTYRISYLYSFIYQILCLYSLSLPHQLINAAPTEGRSCNDAVYWQTSRWKTFWFMTQFVFFIIVATSSFHHRRTSLFHHRRNQFVSSSSQPVCFIIVSSSLFHHRRNQFVSSSSQPVCFIIVATSLHPFSYLCSVMAQGQPCNDFRTNLVLCVLVYHSRTGARSALQRPRVVNVYNEWMFNPSPVIAQGDPATTVHIISTLLTDTISALLTNVVFGSLDSSLQ